MREDPLITGFSYHVFNKSIEGYRIFNNEEEYIRMLDILRYYQFENIPYAYSHAVRLESISKISKEEQINFFSKAEKKRVQILAFCLMPTHIHLMIKQLCDEGISRFMKDLLDSYSKYFNTKHDRKGPLWVGRFKSVLVRTDEQLFHLSRYIHLNPTTSKLVLNPQDWVYSSYLEYLGVINPIGMISDFREIMDISNAEYRRFVEDQIDYQKELARIKHLFFD